MSQKLVNDISVHDDKQISGFFGEYRYMSNFHLCDVYYQGMLYPSSENAYMAAKTLNKDARKQFETMTPKEAKGAGRGLKLRADWDTIKFTVMYEILWDKFSRNRDLANKLMATGIKTLTETNWWGDIIWGVCKGIGENNLGKTLMKVRDKLNEEKSL